MNTLIFIIVVFFTNAGPAQITQRYDGTMAECQNAASIVPTMADKQIPGPDGEPATILDAQAKCIAFTQGTTASEKK